MGLLTAEFVEAAKHVTPQVVLSPVLRPGLNLHAPHVDFHDVVLVLPFDDGRQGSRLIALTSKMLDRSSAHAGSIGFARWAGKTIPCGGGPWEEKVEETGRQASYSKRAIMALNIYRKTACRFRDELAQIYSKIKIAELTQVKVSARPEAENVSDG
jgi:hypothetical protein